MTTPLSRRVLLFAALLAVIIGFFNNLGSIPLFDVDEGAFSEATREMMARHDYISPVLYGEPRYDKPILIYWLQAASVSVLGLNAFALRLPSAAAATLWTLAILLFLARLGAFREGLLAVCLMATSLGVPIIAKAATADALLNLFLTCSMLTIFLFYRERRAGYIYWTFAFMGLGFLTKGPIAVLIPLVVSGLFFALQRDLRGWLQAAFNPRGLALFALIGLPWYGLEYLARGNAFIEGFFGHHNIGRFTGTMEGHGGGYFYYLLVLLIATVPYTSAFIKLGAKAGTLLKQDLERYMSLWFGFVLIFFTLSATKLPHYIVYGLPPAFMLLALHFTPLRRPWLAFLPAALCLAVMALLPELISLVLPAVHDAFTRVMLAHHDRYFSLAYRLFFLSALLITVYFIFDRRLPQTARLVTCGLLISFGVSQFVLPAAAAIQQQPVKDAALIAKARGAGVVMWRLDRPSFGVYSEHPVVQGKPRPGELVVTKSTELPRLGRYRLLYLNNGIALVKLEGPRAVPR